MSESSRSRKREFVCTYCGSPYKAYNENKTCGSDVCINRHLSEKLVPPRQSWKKRVASFCCICGDRFEHFSSHDTKTCSRSCAVLFRRLLKTPAIDIFDARHDGSPGAEKYNNPHHFKCSFETCQNSYVTIRRADKYCSLEHAFLAGWPIFQCSRCGVRRQARGWAAKNRKFCSDLCRQEAGRGHPKSKEHRRKLSKTRKERGLSKGENNPMFGKMSNYT